MDGKAIRVQGVCVIADLSPKNIKQCSEYLIRIPFTTASGCHFHVTQSDCLKDSPAFPFVLKSQKPVVEAGTDPLNFFLPFFSEKRIKGNVVLKAGMG